MQWLTGSTLVLAIIIGLFLLLIHLGFRAPRRPETGTPAEMGLPFKQMRMPTVAGKHLFGWFLPAADAAQTVIILHGWGGNAELMLPLAAPLHQRGLNVLLFDARNHGCSDAHSFSSMPRFAEDLDHAIDWLKSRYPAAIEKLALLGHSVGAGAVLLSASRRDDIAAVITIAAFAHPEWVMRRHLQRFKLPVALIRLVNHYVQWVIGHAFTAIAPINSVCKVNCPVLLVHGVADELVPITDARAIVASCPRDRLSLLEIAGAGHTSVEKVEEHADNLLDFLQQAGFTLR